MANSAWSGNTAGLASAVSPGLVGTGTQTFAGKKTLDGGALIKGETSGVAIAAGYVGSVIGTSQNVANGSMFITTASSSLTTTLASVISASLNKGVYLCIFNGFVNKAINANADRIAGEFYIGGSSVSNSSFSSSPSNLSGAIIGVSISYPALISTDATTLSVYLQFVDSPSSTAGSWKLSIVRIG